MNKALVPELRPDKNGKMVIRHVSPPEATGGAKLPVSPPATTSLHQSERERKKEVVDALSRRMCDSYEDAHQKVSSTLSWFPMHLLENLDEVLDAPPPYHSLLQSRKAMVRAILNNNGLACMMSLGVHDISIALHESGIRTETPFSKSVEYFGMQKPLISMSSKMEMHVNDFRVWYLADTLELTSVSEGGSLAQHRAIERVGANLDKVLHALPVLEVYLNHDRDSYIFMLDNEGIEAVTRIALHVGDKSESDILRICDYLKGQMSHYDEHEVDEMLSSSAPAVSQGWL